MRPSVSAPDAAVETAPKWRLTLTTVASWAALSVAAHASSTSTVSKSRMNASRRVDSTHTFVAVPAKITVSAPRVCSTFSSRVPTKPL